MRPHYSQSSLENATPSSGKSPLASYKEAPPHPPWPSMQAFDNFERNNLSNNHLGKIVRTPFYRENLSGAEESPSQQSQLKRAFCIKNS